MSSPLGTRLGRRERGAPGLAGSESGAGIRQHGGARGRGAPVTTDRLDAVRGVGRLGRSLVGEYRSR